MSDHAVLVQEAARLIRDADALLIAAGAGMGVDSGLPDFRGPEGFWKAYPPFRGRPFREISTPHWFVTDPALAWGFFGHRLDLYRTTQPHAGFSLLKRWAARVPEGAFVFTSNVDGQFLKAGFPEANLYECHGSIHHLQCTGPCFSQLWPVGDLTLDVDRETIRARADLPRCPRCGELARPNILMFGDWAWKAHRAEQQARRYADWLDERNGRNIVAIELGAGIDIPTVRLEAEERGTSVIRINPRDCDPPTSGVALPQGALAALTAIDEVLHRIS